MLSFLHIKRVLSIFAVLGMVALTGCASTSASRDYSAFKQSNPKSILVLPPVNDSPDVKATYIFFSQVSFPIAEAGYYVLPVTLVDETFKQNGLTNPSDIQATPIAKLHQIFGADSAMYIKITRYGASYTVFNSVAVVAAEARLVDLRTGTVLWTGSASASNDEGNNNNNKGGLIGMLVAAAVEQVMNSVTDAAHPVAGVTAHRLLSARHDGILPGPRLLATKKD
jgi:hypothetical protein